MEFKSKNELQMQNLSDFILTPTNISFTSFSGRYPVSIPGVFCINDSKDRQYLAPIFLTSDNAARSILAYFARSGSSVSLTGFSLKEKESYQHWLLSLKYHWHT